MRKLNFLLVFLSLNSILLFAQQNCEVLKADISGTYKGDCKKGLAHGKGVSQGQNKYEGEFKNGLPNGDGIIQYSDGGSYSGTWKNGLRQGEGKYSINLNGIDSIADGIWKNDKYEGKKPTKQYEVFKKISVTRYTIRKVGENSNKVSVKVSDKGKALSAISYVVTSGTKDSRNGYTIFDYINFYPFTCEMRYRKSSELGSVGVDVEFSFRILEPGEYVVEIQH